MDTDTKNRKITEERKVSGKKLMTFLTITIITVLTAAVIMLVIKRSGIREEQTILNSIPGVAAQAETLPVPQGAEDDAADDPAIWINYSNPDSSRIIGTDKKGGLAVYDLSGNQLFYYPDGLMNNADVRYGFVLNGDTIDIMAVSNRTDNTISLYRINKTGSLDKIHKRQIISELEDEVYGLCMYKSPVSGLFYVFMNNKFGVIEQWELFQDADKIDGKIVRKLKVPTQVEGMTADDEMAVLYVGEEDTGIWKFRAEPDATAEGALIPKSGEKDNEYIKYDIEGMAVFILQDGTGYLVVSSQGNDTYAVFRREGTNEYLGSFRITDGTVDGVQITDGLDVTSHPLGTLFPAGLMVAQDGTNMEGDKQAAQNFKLIKWESIASLFSPALLLK